MKVLIFEAGKGLASYTSELANNLADLGVNVYYMTSKSNHRQKDLSPAVHNCCVLDDYNLQYGSFTLKWFFNRFFTLVKNILKRNLFIRRNKIDIVNIQLTIPLVEFFLLKLFVPHYVKYVMTVHNVIPHRKSFFEKGFSTLLKRQNGLIVHTDENVNELEKIFNIKNHVYKIPHGVNLLYKKMGKKVCMEKLNIHTEKPIVLFFGAIKEYKGLDVLIRSLAGVNCFLLIAGHIEGSFKKYQNLLEENHIDCMYFIDFIPEDDIPVFFQSADIAVLPYIDFHSQSGVLLQISKYSVPLVATNVGPFASYSEKYGNALICEKNNTNDLKKTVIQLLNDPDLQNKLKIGAKKIVVDHSWNSVAIKYKEAFMNS